MSGTTAGNIIHGMRYSRGYATWVSMLQRCTNKNNPDYHHYGERGIKACKRWLKFENFFEDMGDRPKRLSIERIDNNKGYSKKNCKWATQTEQVRNTRLQKRNKTGIRGVIWHKRIKKYQAYIAVAGKQIHLGYFDNLKDASEARQKGKILYW